MSNRAEPRATEPKPSAERPTEPVLDSPIKPLLWVLIPFILVMAYGILASN